MNKIIVIVLAIVLNHQAKAQQTGTISDLKITFRLQVVEENPDSAILVWALDPDVGESMNISFFPPATGTNGLQEHTITLPDSVVGKTLIYRYVLGSDKYDFKRSFVVAQIKFRSEMIHGVISSEQRVR